MLKNIVIVSDAANVRGGAENVAVSTASMLAGRGYNVCLLFCGNRST